MLNFTVNARATCCARVPPFGVMTRFMSNTPSSGSSSTPPEPDQNSASTSSSSSVSTPSSPIFSSPPPCPLLTLSRYSPPKLKVVVFGANGGIGKTLSFLLAQNPTVTDLNLYDAYGAEALAADISHTETAVNVTGFVGAHNLHFALEDCDIVVCCAGIPPRPNVPCDQYFHENARVVYDLIQECAIHCPSAMTVILTEPINSIVPIAAEVYKTAGTYKPRRLFGVSHDVIRANSLLAKHKNLNPRDVHCTVVGGHSEGTCVPVFSQCIPNIDLSIEAAYDLTVQLNKAVWEAPKTKASRGDSSSISMGYAGAKFVYSLIRAIRGEDSVMECAFVPTDSNLVKYFTSNVLLGVDGYERSMGIGTLTKFERSILRKALPIIRNSIERGEMFVREQKKKKASH